MTALCVLQVQFLDCLRHGYNNISCRLKFIYLLPALIWILVISIVIVTPGDSLPKSYLFDIPFFDKFIHLALFFIFAVLLYIGLHKQSETYILKRWILTFTIITGLAYSITTEIIQYYLAIGRSGDFLDFVANITGFLLGVVFIRRIIKFYNSYILRL